MRRTVLLSLIVALLAGCGEVPATTSPVPYTSPTPKPEQPAALFIGDSYTAGRGAANPAQAESCLTATAMGWLCNLDAQGGTGFVANGHNNQPTFQAIGGRLAEAHHKYLADIILIDAGRNDGRTPRMQVQEAVVAYLTALRGQWPAAKLVIVAPYFMASTRPLLGPKFTAFLKAQAQAFRGQIIDPIGEGWVKAPITAAMTISDKVHPSPDGHRYLAEHLTADLKALGLTNVPITDMRGARAGLR